MSWTRLRSVAEEMDVTTSVDLHCETYPRFADFWEGIKWLLSRTPDLEYAFRRSDSKAGFRLYVFAGDVVADTPNVAVTYHFTDDEVTILGVMVAPRAPATD